MVDVPVEDVVAVLEEEVALVQAVDVVVVAVPAEEEVVALVQAVDVVVEAAAAVLPDCAETGIAVSAINAEHARMKISRAVKTRCERNTIKLPHKFGLFTSFVLGKETQLQQQLEQLLPQLCN